MDGDSCLQAAGEAHEVRTETKASTLASRYADRRRDQVQHSKDRRGHESERRDLIEGERLAGDEDSSTSHYEAFN